MTACRFCTHLPVYTGTASVHSDAITVPGTNALTRPAPLSAAQTSFEIQHFIYEAAEHLNLYEV